MRLFDFLKRDKIKGNYLIALDIGSEFVKVLVFEVDRKNKQAVIVGSAIEAQEFKNMDNGAVADIKGVVFIAKKAIDNAIKEANKKVKSKINVKQAVLGIAGEFVKGITTTVKYERGEPENKIDISEFKNIIQKVQWKAFEKVRNQFTWETGMSDIDVRLINAHISDMQLDGYRITNLLDFQGKEVMISIFNGYAPLVHLSSLQTIISDLGLELLSIAVEPFAIARSVKLDQEENLNAIFIDIGSTTTDVAVVRDGGVEGTKSFALGGKMFSKRLAQELSISFSEAENLKLKYSNGKLSDAVLKRVRSIIKNDCGIWLGGVELCLKEFSHLNLLPLQIYLCGGGSSLPDLVECLSSKEWIESLSFVRKPAVDYIDIKKIKGVSGGELKGNQFTTVMSLASLSLELIEKDIVNDILQKTVRIIQN